MVVDLFGPFNHSGDLREHLCALTLVCSPLHDLHPSDQGYRLIGTLIAERLGR